ncbi:MAG: hypothetical protein H7Y41_02470 [Hyphomonadaceae bacterium]|nr:hypothetical protein [Clostridia bacterium]
MALVTDLVVNMMQFSLRTKLTVSYVFIALICVGLVSVITNALLDKQFQTYVKQNQEQKNKDIVIAITQQFHNNSWNVEGIESIGMSAIENSLIVRVRNSGGNALWDATVHNNGMCERIIQQTAMSMKSRYPNFKGEFVQKVYPIILNDKTVGTVEIGSYGPFYFSQSL